MPSVRPDDDDNGDEPTWKRRKTIKATKYISSHMRESKGAHACIQLSRAIVFDRIIMFTLSKYLSFVFALTFPLLLLLLSTIHAIVVYHRRLRFLLFILPLSPSWIHAASNGTISLERCTYNHIIANNLINNEMMISKVLLRALC